MKKTIVGLSALLLSSSAFAGGIIIAPNYFDGFYAGASGGVQANQARVNGTTTTRPFAPFDVLINTNNFGGTLGDTSAVGNLFAGYGTVLNGTTFYLGGEIGVNFSDFDAALSNSQSTAIAPGIFENLSIGNTSNSTAARMSTAEFTVDFKPGYLLSEKTMVYGLVGAAFNTAKLTSSTSYVPLHYNGVDYFRTDTSSEASKSVTGLRLGVGIDTIIGDYWSVGLRYVYTKYSSIDVSSDGFTPYPPPSICPIGAGLHNSTSIKPRKHSTMLVLTRYFD